MDEAWVSTKGLGLEKWLLGAGGQEGRGGRKPPPESGGQMSCRQMSGKQGCAGPAGAPGSAPHTPPPRA